MGFLIIEKSPACGLGWNPHDFAEMEMKTNEGLTCACM